MDIAVIRLPHMTNYTVFAMFEYMDGVSLRYVRSRHELGSPDLIILPGSKSCMDAMQWLRESGLAGTIVRLAAHTPVVGISAGMSLLGRQIFDPQGLEKGDSLEGLGLLPLTSTLTVGSVGENSQSQRKGRFPQMDGFFSKLSGLAYEGYTVDKSRFEFLEPDVSQGCNGKCGEEGQTKEKGENNQLFVEKGHVFGCLLHGLFDKEAVARNLVSTLLSRKGLKEDDIETFDLDVFKQTQYDILADAVRKSIDMQQLYKIIEEGVK